MTNNIPNSAVEKVLAGKAPADAQARMAELEAELVPLKKKLADAERVERFWKMYQSAYGKIRCNLFTGLTDDEVKAMDGVYFFIHNGMVDMVRKIPSATDKGEGKRFLDKVEQGEALAELSQLYKDKPVETGA